MSEEFMTSHSLNEALTQLDEDAVKLFSKDTTAIDVWNAGK